MNHAITWRDYGDALAHRPTMPPLLADARRATAPLIEPDAVVGIDEVDTDGAVAHPRLARPGGGRSTDSYFRTSGEPVSWKRDCVCHALPRFAEKCQANCL